MDIKLSIFLNPHNAILVDPKVIKASVYYPWNDSVLVHFESLMSIYHEFGQMNSCSQLQTSGIYYIIISLFFQMSSETKIGSQQIKDFDDILSHVGGWGPFQYYSTLVFFLFNIFLGYVYLSPILTLYTPPHTCR